MGWEYVSSSAILPISLGFADTSSLVDRGLSLGYHLLDRRERFRHAAVWRSLGNDCIIWHWGVQVTNAVSGPWRSSLGRATEGWGRCDRPGSCWICVLQSLDVIQFQRLRRILALIVLPHDARSQNPGLRLSPPFTHIETLSTLQIFCISWSGNVRRAGATNATANSQQRRS